MQLAASVT